jgi:hypothetical protein
MKLRDKPVGLVRPIQRTNLLETFLLIQGFLKVGFNSLRKQNKTKE